MDKLSINEGLLVLLMERDDVDGTNAVALFRNAQKVVVDGLSASENPVHGLARLRSADEVDDLLIGLSNNGRRDIFLAE